MAKKKKVEARVVEAEDKMYEILFILKPDMLESAITKKLKEFNKFLEEGGCKITVEDVWGKRPLAYKIKQFNEGIYVAYNLKAPTSFIKELDNHIRIDNQIIRHIVVTLNEEYTYFKFYEEKEEKGEKEEKKTFNTKHKRAYEKEVPRKEQPAKEEVKEDVKPTEEPSEPKKEEKVSKEIKEVKKEVKEVNKNELDAKLDKLLDGDDLNI